MGYIIATFSPIVNDNSPQNQRGEWAVFTAWHEEAVNTRGKASPPEQKTDGEEGRIIE
jgi:hypothetical protein